jgi:hypothetical protein
MCRDLFKRLTSDEFAASAIGWSTPETFRHFLMQSEEVRDTRKALRQEAVTEDTIREWVSSWMKDFRPGQHFPHETAIAAMAIVLETWATDFAEEFLLDLASLKLAEMPLCIRVARQCLKRRTMMARNKARDFYPRPWYGNLTIRETKSDYRHPSESIQTVSKSFDMRPIHART